MNFFPGSQHSKVEELNAYNVHGDLHVHPSQGGFKDEGLCELLRPIEDASHTRDRKRSPPDSACMPGTRVEVVQNVNTWACGHITSDTEPHMRWMHGYVGSGKSSISQEVCDTAEREDRPVASFFFFRNAGDRSKIWKLATTLASQMAADVPETEPFIRSAVRANRAVLRPGTGGVSLGSRMRLLVYAPFKAAVERGASALARGPFLIVLDGLDECEDKDEVQELIDGMLSFFNESPLIPLRVFITSRVEQHIQARLNVPGVQLDNLVDHCSDDDIATFLQILFEDAYRRNAVIQAYVRQHGEWPTSSDRNKLVRHIGGSFIFASAVFKFIMGSPVQVGLQSTTPMDRLPLALKMNPGLDGLYAQTLARSQHFPHFLDIISAIVLLRAPLPTSGIAELLGVHTYEVVNVLVDLQAIIQVPGTDDIPVTLCHTSLRDFLTSQSRSGHFLAHPRHHVRLFLRCLGFLCQKPGVPIHALERPTAAAYALEYSTIHLVHGASLFEQSEIDSALRACRAALELCPDLPGPVHALAALLVMRAEQKRSPVDLKEAISVHREALGLQPSPHPRRSRSLNSLGNVYLELFRHTNAMADLEEAISLHREALNLRLSPHPERSTSLHNLGSTLVNYYLHTGTMSHLEEVISLHREALELRPSSHPEHSFSLSYLAAALVDSYRSTGTMADLDEAVSLHRDALELRPSPHPQRSWSLNNLGGALMDYYRLTGTMTDLEEAISLHREALNLQTTPRLERSRSLSHLGGVLVDYYRRTGTVTDLKEAISLHREGLKLRPSPHPERSWVLNNLGGALVEYYRLTGTMTDLEEAISLHREALDLRTPPHLERSRSLSHLGGALMDHYQRTRTMADLKEAISLHRGALELRPLPHPWRSWSLNHLGTALLYYYSRKGTLADLEEAISLHREALELRPLPNPDRAMSLTSFVISLNYLYQETRQLPHLQEAMTHGEELLVAHYPPGHKYRAQTLNLFLSLLQTHFNVNGNPDDLCRIEQLKKEAIQLSATGAAT